MSQKSIPVATPVDLKSRTAASYNILAPRYNAWTLKDPSIRLEWVAKMQPLLPSSPDSTKILELGAGAGLPTTKALLDFNENVHVIANDLSSHQLELAATNLSAYKERVEFNEGDMLQLPIPPSSLSAVVGMYSLIHLPRTEQTSMLQKISTWLKPGGLFLANFSLEAAEGQAIEDWLGEPGAWMFWSGWGAEGSVGMIEEAGLEILEKDVVEDVVDAAFLWVLARKKTE